MVLPSPQEAANYGMLQGHHQLINIEIDLVSGGNPSKELYYKIKSSFTKQISSLAGPVAAYTIMCSPRHGCGRSLVTDLSLSLLARFVEGKPRLKSKKQEA